MTSLSQMLTEETVALGVRVHDWQEAVRAAGNLLVQAGKVEPRYVDAMIKMSQEIGPYIVIAPGVALPHARPEDGVREACMSLVTLDPPIYFGNENNDPVRLVVAFGSADSGAHISALSDLGRLLGDASAVTGILNASSGAQLLELVRRSQRKHNSKQMKEVDAHGGVQTGA